MVPTSSDPRLGLLRYAEPSRATPYIDLQRTAVPCATSLRETLPVYVIRSAMSTTKQRLTL